MVKRKWFAMFVLAVLLLAVPMVKLVKASCYGSACFNKDPQVEGCSSGATSVGGINYSGSLVTELRKSTTCGAKWTRVSSSDWNNHHFMAQTYSLYLETYAESWNASWGGIWTPMVNGVTDTKCAYGGIGPAGQSLNVYSSWSPCN